MKLALIRELDGRGTATTQGASSTAVWLRERLRLTVPAARRLVDLAAVLDTGNPGVRHALADGHITVEQARVITDTIDTVQTAAGPEAADKALGVLVEWAGQFDPTLLRKLSTRILDHVAPDIADAAAKAALDAEARRAHPRPPPHPLHPHRRPSATHRHPRHRDSRAAPRRHRPTERTVGP